MSLIIMVSPSVILALPTISAETLVPNKEKNKIIQIKKMIVKIWY